MTAYWDLSCRDWAERLRRGESLVPDLPLDNEAARLAVSVFDDLRLPDVPGTPRLRDASGDWQRDIVAALFGSIERETGMRRIREAFIMVPKKNSKTTGSAAIALTALLLNERPNAEMLLIGPMQEIASRAFRAVKGMIELSPVLQRKLHVRDHLKTIVHRVTGAQLRVLTFDEKITTGSKAVFVLIDELHSMGEMAKAPYALEQLRGGQVPFPEAMTIFITTQSARPPAGVFREELQKARDIRDGRRRNSRMLPVLYEFPEEIQKQPDAWRDPAVWSMVSPNMGRSLRLEALIEGFNDADAKGESALRSWASQHLNIEIGVGMNADGWRGADYWEQAADRSLTIDEIVDRSEVVVMGVDGGGLDDLFGVAVAGRCRRTKQWLFALRAWAQTDVLDRRKVIASRLHDFAADGDLVICETPRQDIEDIVALAVKLRESGRMPAKDAIGLDPIGVAALVEGLIDAGFAEDQLTAVRQGYMLNSAIAGLERKLKDGSALHDGSRLGAWCVGNVKVEMRGNAMSITKAASGRAKIDPIVAMMNATKLLEWAPVARRSTPWDDDPNFRLETAA